MAAAIRINVDGPKGVAPLVHFVISKLFFAFVSIKYM